MTARLTPAAIAEETGHHPVTVRSALQDGTLHGFQRVRGGRWRVERACLDAWIENRKCPHREAAEQVANLADHRAKRGA